LIGSNPKGGATSNKQWSHQEKGAMKQKKLSQRFDIPFQCLFIPEYIVHLLFFFHFIAVKAMEDSSNNGSDTEESEFKKMKHEEAPQLDDEVSYAVSAF
jgi:hypothetical protein